MQRGDERPDTQILKSLREAGRAGRTTEEVRLALAIENEAARAALDRLAADGQIVRWSNKWFLLAGSRWRVGRLTRKTRTESEVTCFEPSGARRVYRVAERDRRGARSGDRVLVRPLARKSTERRRKHAGTSTRMATVVRVLERARRYLVGRLERDHEEWKIWSWARGLALDAQDLRVVPSPDLEPGLFVVVEMPAQGERETRGKGPEEVRLVERLGTLEDAGTDVRVVLRHFEIPDEYPAEALAAASRLRPYRFDPDSSRRDLRRRLAVTVDGQDARDFDDAISVERMADRFRVSVHIADVAHYLEPGGVLDREAYRRGTSVYFPERAVHMLPPRLSEELCSLVEGHDRPTVTVEFTVDAKGRRSEIEVFESVIRSRARLTYSQVQALFEHRDARVNKDVGEGDRPGSSAGARKETLTPPIVDLLLAGRAAARRLRSRRNRDGAIDFDLPLPDLSLDERGELIQFEGGRRLEAHRLIEELMIAANRCVAERVSRDANDSGLGPTGASALYRDHPPPSDEDLEPVASIARGLGLLESETKLEASQLGPLIERARSSGNGELISRLALRAMGRATYSADCTPHFALAADAYSHFTSPIRRYPDLLVHRQVKGMVSPQQPTAAEAAVHLSRSERRAESAERDLREWKKLRYLADRIGDPVDGTITGVAEFGIFVVLSELVVDGLVPLEYLRDDDYRLEQEHHRLVGEQGHQLRLGDRVDVVIHRVDLSRRRLVLALPGSAHATAERGGKGPKQKSRRRPGGRGHGGKSEGERRSNRRGPRTRRGRADRS